MVEDDEDQLELLGALLEHEGFEISRFRSAEQALAALCIAPPPHLILLDLRMPGMGGWRFRLEQRKNPVLRHTPVVVFSGDSSPSAEAIDAAAYLRKPLDFDRLMLVIRDLLAAEERRQSAVQAIELDRLKLLEVLVGHVAHEVNNPLTYVMGSLSLAQKQCHELRDDSRAEAGLAGELRRNLDVANQGSESIASVVRDLATLVRGGASRSTPLDLTRPLDAAVRIVRDVTPGSVEFVTAFGEPLLVQGTEARLSQVFLNLLINAAQAIPEGRPGKVRVLTCTEGAHAVVKVIDSGLGIGPELAPRIFEAFFTTRPRAAGLGLTLASSAVAAMGGSLSFESEVGRGTTFRMELPLLEARGATSYPRPYHAENSQESFREGSFPAA